MQVFESVAGCDQNNDADSHMGKVLLTLQAVIGGNEDLKSLLCRALQKLTVL